MANISLCEAVTLYMGEAPRSPQQEAARYNDAASDLKKLYDTCRRDWPPGGLRRDPGQRGFGEVLLPWPPSLIIEKLQPLGADWPDSLAELLNAAKSYEWLDRHSKAYRSKLQTLLDLARSGDIDLIARRLPKTRLVKLSAQDLAGPYDLDAAFLHLVPDAHVRASANAHAAATWSNATYYDVAASEFQIAYFAEKTDDARAFQEDKVRVWYQFAHVPFYASRGEIPNRAKSKADAVAEFGNILGLNQILVDCRSQLAPAAWRKSGRRGAQTRP